MSPPPLDQKAQFAIRLSRTTRQDIICDAIFHWSASIASNRIRHSRRTESDGGYGP